MADALNLALDLAQGLSDEETAGVLALATQVNLARSTSPCPTCSGCW